jgi:hypothetical protein
MNQRWDGYYQFFSPDTEVLQMDPVGARPILLRYMTTNGAMTNRFNFGQAISGGPADVLSRPSTAIDNRGTFGMRAKMKRKTLRGRGLPELNGDRARRARFRGWRGAQGSLVKLPLRADARTRLSPIAVASSVAGGLACIYKPGGREITFSTDRKQV